MELQTYKLVAKSDLYTARYTLRAPNMQDACKKAKIKFARSYNVFGDKVKIGLEPKDLKNHIEEILSMLHKDN